MVATAEKIGYHNLAFKASSKQVTMPSAAKSEVFYQGCDRSKSCFGLPNGCIARMNCKSGVAMSSEFGGRSILHLMAEGSPAYVAVGLSEDDKMVMRVVNRWWLCILLCYEIFTAYRY